MYNLCKIDNSAHNGAVLGHPFNVVYTSDSLDKISVEIAKRIRDGCPVRTLKVFKDVNFATILTVDFEDETDGHDQEN